MRCSGRRIASLEGMRNRIDTRVAARLAAAALAVGAALTPITAAAAAHDLCDGHKWSLFGCRHHQIEQPGAVGSVR